MTKQRKSFWLRCAAAAAVLGLVLFFVLSHDAGPYYKGKPLDTYWFHELSMSVIKTNHSGGVSYVALHGHAYGLVKENVLTVSNAIIDMGTNCLPLLMGKLEKHDSAFRKRAEKWLGRVGINWTPWRDADWERAQAVTALFWLGRNQQVTPEALNRIQKLCKDKDANVAAPARFLSEKVLPYSP